MRTINSNWFIRARLKHRHLLVLVALGETSNLNHAARGLGISQPAISKLLKEVEDSLEVPLFERHPRGVIPTMYGDTMIRYARHALKTLDNAFEEISAIRQGLSGHVRIGTILTPCTDLIPEAMHRIRKEHPALEISVRTGSSEELLIMLKNDEIDIAIARLQSTFLKFNFQYEPIYHKTTYSDQSEDMFEQGTSLYTAHNTMPRPEPVMVCAKSSHEICNKSTPQPIESLLEKEWVLPPKGSIMRAEFEAIIKRKGLPLPNHIVTAENLLMVTNLLEKNDMLTLLPEAVMYHYMKYGMIEQVMVDSDLQQKLGKILEPYGLIHKGEGILAPASRAVLELLRQARNYTHQPATSAI
ncbi:LysR family transcriptional regulator [Marinomonas atlantica]|uniref:LysR family transcriptional regulator n=1 Tax=Marinomonas atlantica TaxID=1806668 RepID=UPI0009EDE493|nr:LysR substrate-binding domain-containing protein [Marinomonas atlantica]